MLVSGNLKYLQFPGRIELAMCHVCFPFKFLMVHVIFWGIKITCHIADTTNRVIMPLGCLRAGRMRYIGINFWWITAVEAINWILMMQWLVYSSLPLVQLSAIAVWCHLKLIPSHHRSYCYQHHCRVDGRCLVAIFLRNIFVTLWLLI